MIKLGQKLSTKIAESGLSNFFWRHPDRLKALKVVSAMACVVVPFILLDMAFFGATMALGTVGAALSETDDHPKGRLKTVALTLLSFAVTTTSVALLKPYPILFGGGLILSTIVFVLAGGMGERYRSISYGAILIGIYAMLVFPNSPNWYFLPLLLCSGALFYSAISVLLLFYKPMRLLEEQLSRGFVALANYLEEKSKMFPGTEEQEIEIGSHLAILNVQVVTALEKCKAVLNSYNQEITDSRDLLPYLQRFMLLQSLHERAASSHERYKKLGSRPEYKEILGGFGELFMQLSNACRLVSVHMLTGEEYEHPVSIGWIVHALESEIEKMTLKDQQLLILLLHNLSRSHQSLQNLNDPDESTSIPRLGQDTRGLFERFTDQLHWKHPRFRYAIRLSSCFLVGLIIISYFNLEKGEWILLTSLLVNQPTFSETRRRLFQRVGGTITGVVIGVVVIQLLPTHIGQLLLMLAAVYWFFIWRFENYSRAVIFITIYVLCSNNLTIDRGVEVMVPRVIDTVIGAVLAILSVRLLWPDWQHKRLPGLLLLALSKNRNYFQAILNEYQKMTNFEDDYEYRLARRQAHKADNDLTLSWQSMRLEPKRQQGAMQHAFAITYLNHALLSYISALGARRDSDFELFKDFKSLSAIVDNALGSVCQIINGEQMSEEFMTLKTLLVDLKNRIKEVTNQKERQQLRLLYNIAGVTNKLLIESQAQKELETPVFVLRD